MGVDFNAIRRKIAAVFIFLTHPAWRARQLKRDDVLPIFVSYFRAAMARAPGRSAVGSETGAILCSV